MVSLSTMAITGMFIMGALVVSIVAVSLYMSRRVVEPESDLEAGGKTNLPETVKGDTSADKIVAGGSAGPV